MDIVASRRNGWWRAGEGRSWPRLLLVAGLLALAAVLVAALILPAETSEEDGASRAVAGVSKLAYPASVIRETEKPVDGEWIMPAAALPGGNAIFVLDTGNDRILKVNDAGHVLATFDSATDERLALRQPMAMASDGRLLVIANSQAGEVLVLDLSGSVQRVFPLRADGGGETPRPIGVAMTADGGIVVSDAENHRVLRLDESGTVLWSAGTGTRARGPEGFNVPAALAVDEAGNVYVVDTLNGRVVMLSSDGAFVREFGRPGDTAGTLSRPKGVAVDGEGRVFVSDGLQAAVQVFAADGNYLGVIGRRDPSDPTSGSVFRAPAGLWLAGDRLLVTDRFAGLITFDLSDAPSLKPATGGGKSE